MSEQAPFVSVDEIRTATGLGRNQVWRDVKEGRLPGEIRYRKLLVLRAEWNRFLAGEWEPRAQGEPAVELEPARKPVGISSIADRQSA